MTYYKVLNEDRSATRGTGRWTPGRWRSVTGDLVPCENGLHLCRREDLVYWLGPTIWTAEIADESEDESEIIAANDKVIVRRARILDRLDTWNERTARLFAADCAEHVLPIYEAVCDDDPRPRQAIEVARRYPEGQATKEELVAAYWAAASAAHSAASHLGGSAYWAATSAADSAAYRAATWAATALAADSALMATKAPADWAAERAWQTERLFFYLEGGAV